MNTKTLLIIGVIVVVIASVAFSVGSGRKQPDVARDSSGLIVSTNAIYVAGEPPSKTVSVTVVRFEKPGFVVIHEDAAGGPGGILGASRMLPVGETKNLAPIALSRATKNGETIYAMLHIDDGDSVFDAVDDKPARDPVGGEPVVMIFTVSAEAEEPDSVNL